MAMRLLTLYIDVPAELVEFTVGFWAQALGATHVIQAGAGGPEREPHGSEELRQVHARVQAGHLIGVAVVLVVGRQHVEERPLPPVGGVAVARGPGVADPQPRCCRQLSTSVPPLARRQVGSTYERVALDRIA